MRRVWVLVAVVLVVLAAGGIGPAAGEPAALTIYSGRSRDLVAPLFERFTASTGIQVRVRYGETAELAATILEEGANSPADVYFAQDAGALGALAFAGRLRALPEQILSRVEPRFRSADGRWVGVSGRARVVVYNTRRLRPEELPASIAEFAQPKWRGRIGWAPTNGSFQAHVTAMRLLWGNERTRRWLLGIKANGARAYRNNTAIVAAVGAGEIDVGFVNHYYLFAFLRERGPAFPARNYFFPGADAGNLVNVAGVGVVDTARAPAAQRFVEFLLSPEAQRYFAGETFEYPLVSGIPANPLLPPLAQIRTPQVDLNHLQALEETLKLLRETGLL
ncbi:MAG: iron ABC transporter substrate-binding protein [Armatimonadota bacterium]|nr:iron ABC transporter substrate-binding protein [Armatimonadota bacterium]MDR7451886.1 iron ABC transporter substrate-binding protein [Armatimonadota bacterium]MDR7467611.1 iron ABC transporter substrate-binding protein [Armatimonadota bacterium]MDR7494428.1 iron ABC transporter substrate-binding protein [Armatimonadota bacterium]MDR7500408.1 iron ABC transporter substrate-binding protein [Armatimonadota bacterium]